MTNLFGEYEVSVDDRGRFLVPSAFRKQLAEGASARFVINRGFEKCLTLFPAAIWESVTKEINKLNDFDPNVRNFKRAYLNGATVIEVDSAGRILLPKTLMQYAGIEKDMVLYAQGNKVELWDKGTYQEMMNQITPNLPEMVKTIDGGNFNPFANLG